MLSILSLAGICGTLFGEHLFNIELFGIVPLLKLSLNYLLLQCAWYGITLLFSAFSREAGRVAMIGFLLAILSYVVQVIGQLWSRAAFLLPYSLHTYYAPQSVLSGNSIHGTSLLVLSLVFCATVLTAGRVFQRRDIQ